MHESIQACKHLQLPVAIHAKWLNGAIQEALRFNSVGEFKRLLQEQIALPSDNADEASASPDELQLVRKEAIEMGLARLGGVAGKRGKVTAEHCCNIAAIARAAFAEPDALRPCDGSDLLLLSSMFLLMDPAATAAESLRTQEEALTKVKAIAADDAYDGVLKSFVCMSTWPQVLGLSEVSLAAKKKSEGPAQSLRDLALASSSWAPDVDASVRARAALLVEHCVRALQESGYKKGDMVSYSAILANHVEVSTACAERAGGVLAELCNMLIARNDEASASLLDQVQRLAAVTVVSTQLAVLRAGDLSKLDFDSAVSSVAPLQATIFEKHKLCLLCEDTAKRLQQVAGIFGEGKATEELRTLLNIFSRIDSDLQHINSEVFRKAYSLFIGEFSVAMNASKCYSDVRSLAQDRHLLTVGPALVEPRDS